MFRKVFICLAVILGLVVLIYPFIFRAKSCGGLAANLPLYQCPFGYTCQVNEVSPDALGVCRFSPTSAMTKMMNNLSP